MSYKEIQIDLIKSNPNNPRATFSGPTFEDLVNSIREKGILEPILVRPVNGNYEVVAGERRFRALFQLAKEYTGPVKIPAIIRKLNEDEAFEIMTIENLQREDVHPLDEADGFRRLMDEAGYSADQVAEVIGQTRSYVYHRLKLWRKRLGSGRRISGGILPRSGCPSERWRPGAKTLLHSGTWRN